MRGDQIKLSPSLSCLHVVTFFKLSCSAMSVRFVRLSPPLLEGVGWKVFSEAYFQNLLKLADDRVPNVRLALAQVLKEPAFSTGDGTIDLLIHAVLSMLTG